MTDGSDFLFDIITGSKSTQGGNYIRDGRGRLIVDKIEMEKKQDGPFFIVEFIVESSQKVQVVSLGGDGNKAGTVLDLAPNEPGSRCSMSIPLANPKIKSGPGNVKAFVLALLGYTEAAVDAQPGALREALSQLRSPAQPARGMVIDFETYRKLKRERKNDGKDEMVHPRWSHVPPAQGNSRDQISARRAKLEGAKDVSATQSPQGQAAPAQVKA
jgi:hypothetical protein